MKVFFLFILTGFCTFAFSQSDLPKYWITFSGKTHTPFSVERPEEFLSERAIGRRERQGIAIDESDLPVDPAYLALIRNKGVTIINVSNWFNGALVELIDESSIDTLRALPFVNQEIIRVKPPIGKIEPGVSRFKRDTLFNKSTYGFSLSQISMLNGDVLHKEGFTGEGMRIAILDAGFTNAHNFSSLQHVWNENRVIAVRDFVKDGSDILSVHSHGAVVFSILAGYEPGVLIGSAPDSEYILARTEDGNSEYIIEEYNWLCGAEFADSLGADIINTSLGYTVFDDVTQNHSYEDMDGNTTPVSRAAKMAARKGIIVVSSAGNSGNNSWYRISSPADTDSILAVAAVDSLGRIAGFSSRGPSYDKRIKPDVAAQGSPAVAQINSGTFIYVSGTSAASPLIAGLTACLWQAKPEATGIEIMESVRRSGSRYVNPDSAYGFGIPNFVKATALLFPIGEAAIHTPLTMKLFPNPAGEKVYLQIYRPDQNNTEEITIRVFDIQGRLNLQFKKRITGNNFVADVEEISNLPAGMYQMEIIMENASYSIMLSKTTP